MISAQEQRTIATWKAWRCQDGRMQCGNDRWTASTGTGFDIDAHAPSALLLLASQHMNGR
jgi:hypothetical protein